MQSFASFYHGVWNQMTCSNQTTALSRDFFSRTISMIRRIVKFTLWIDFSENQIFF